MGLQTRHDLEGLLTGAGRARCLAVTHSWSKRSEAAEEQRVHAFSPSDSVFGWDVLPTVWWANSRLRLGVGGTFAVRSGVGVIVTSFTETVEQRVSVTSFLVHISQTRPVWDCHLSLHWGGLFQGSMEAYYAIHGVFGYPYGYIHCDILRPFERCTWRHEV